MRLAKSIELWPLERLKPYDRNARTHSQEQVAKIAASITEFGFNSPILVAQDDGIIAGHGRLAAARKLGLADVPVIVLDHLSPAQRRAYVLADNRIAEDAGWDMALLAEEIGDLDAVEFDLDAIGFEKHELDALLADGLLGDEPHEDQAARHASNDNSGGDGAARPQPGALAARFLIPPFTVLNAREGWWQDRKRAWASLGINSEVGRTENLLRMSDTCSLGGKDTSIFDPVLCELAYTWFCPAGGTVVDPFAGGSVRGIVASKLGRLYVGGELRAAQVEANRDQAAVICANSDAPPRWIEGDSRHLDVTAADLRADLVFTCPPYADLEVYSDDPADLSNMEYAEFVSAYREIIAKACGLLKQNRFAVCVVGEVRDKRGNYRDFIGDTVQAFRDAGLQYYNEAILVTAVGSLPVRAGKHFSASRKLGKTHQNVLVFVKGDGKAAAKACGDIVVAGEELGSEEDAA